MKVNGIKCIECGDIIYSRARHDFRRCTCGSVGIDGGFDYMKVSGVGFIHKSVMLKGITKDMLYDDWNTNKDKYGRICEKKRVSKTR